MIDDLAPLHSLYGVILNYVVVDELVSGRVHAVILKVVLWVCVRIGTRVHMFTCVYMYMYYVCIYINNIVWLFVAFTDMPTAILPHPSGGWYG